MNVTNFESRNAMATKRTDYPNNAYLKLHNGLIKSASTSSCSASENALLKKLHKNKFLLKNVGNGAIENERLKLFVLQPLSHSEQNVPLLSSNEEDKTVKRNFHYNWHSNNLKHFSEYDLCDVPRSNAEIRSKTSSSCVVGQDEFDTHRGLNNVLICRGDNNGDSIINFTAINDFKSSKARVNTSNSSKKLNSSSQSEMEYSKEIRNDNKSEAITTTNVTNANNHQICEYGHVELNSPHIDSDVNKNTTIESNLMTTKTKNIENLSNDYSSAEFNEKNENDKKLVEANPEKDDKRFRRSSSLKAPKESSSSNSAQKKIVRFADAMGLDLADIRTFLDELPLVPKSAYSDLRNEDVTIFPPPIDKSFSQSLFSFPSQSSTRSLVPMFKQPNISLNFLDRVRDQYVCLDHAIVCDTPVCSITGIVRVRNLDFYKSVFVRYTCDNWRSYTENQCVYVPDSCDGFSDKFSFIIYLYHVPISQRVEIAIRYHCCGHIFWDNNYGANYVFQSFSSAPIIPSYFQCLSPTKDTCNSFY